MLELSKTGHESYQCREKLQCPRCRLEHKVQVFNTEIGDATCCNCGGRHSSSYKGCETYKKAVFELKEKTRNTPEASSTAVESHHHKTNFREAAAVNHQNDNLIQIHPKVLLAAMAEYLEAMVKTIKSSNPIYDPMTPFNVVSSI
jgi:hypothetical protein